MFVRSGLDWIEGSARLFPDQVAVVDGDCDESFTYQEVNERAIQLTKYLSGCGILKGDRVALMSPNHISYFDFLFACMKIGAIFVPLNWRLSKEELTYVLEDSEPKIIGIHNHFAKESSWIQDDYSVFNISDNQYIERLDDSNNRLKDVTQSPEEPLAMMYTGGTTGKPKGVVLSHDSIRWNALNTIVSWNLTNEDITLTSLPMFHAGGLNALSVPLLMCGGKVVLSSSFEPNKAVQDLIRFQCSIVLFIPTMYHLMVRSEVFQKASFDHMKVFLSGGAPCPRAVYEAFAAKGLLFKEGYGLTEAGPNNFFIDPCVAQEKLGSVGKAMVFNDIRLVDDNRVDVKPNEVGELLLRGDHTFEYYWNKPEATRTSIIDGWFHTGDLARQDVDGYVYIVGRKKEMIITGGENVYPLEIEHWLESHDAINEVAVVGIPDEKWGEVVTAFVSIHDGFTLPTEELRFYCSQKLTRYKIPKEFHIMEELPKTHVGKIDKQSLMHHKTRQH